MSATSWPRSSSPPRTARRTRSAASGRSRRARRSSYRQSIVSSGRSTVDGGSADRAPEASLLDFDRVEEVEQGDRLDEVVLEADLVAADPVALLAVPGHRQEAQVRAEPLAQGQGQLVAVHDRQPDVEDGDLRLEHAHPLERLR